MWQVGIFVCIGWIVSVCLHEFGHAVVAYWGGDTSVKDKGYLTLNPLKYTDPGLSLLFPILFLIIGGIALPGGVVYIDRSRLRNRWWDSAVSAAGPFVNLLVTFLLIIPFLFHWETWLNNEWFFPSLAFLVVLQIFAIIFNLLPLPPLDGYGIIRPWLSPQIQQFLSPLYKYGIWIVLGLLWFSPPISNALWVFIFKISLIFGVPIDRAIEGFELFNSPINKFILVSGLLLVLWLIKKKNNSSHISSQNHQSEKVISNDWYQEVWQLENNQQYQEALELYDKKLQENSKDSMIWYYRGLLLEHLKSYQEAVTSYKKTLQLNPENVEAWYNLAYCLYQLKQYKGAIKAYEKVIKLQPDCADAWYNQACCHALQNQSKLALQCLEKAIALDPIKFKNYSKTDPDLQSLYQA